MAAAEVIASFKARSQENGGKGVKHYRKDSVRNLTVSGRMHGRKKVDFERQSNRTGRGTLINEINIYMYSRCCKLMFKVAD
jgi:hypothetical protein